MSASKRFIHFSAVNGTRCIFAQNDDWTGHSKWLSDRCILPHKERCGNQNCFRCQATKICGWAVKSKWLAKSHHKILYVYLVQPDYVADVEFFVFFNAKNTTGCFRVSPKKYFQILNCSLDFKYRVRGTVKKG